MKALPALAALLSILACALWIAALTAPWYHAPNRDGTEQRMGLFGSYHVHTGHPTATSMNTYDSAIEDAMGITTLREREEAHHRGDKGHGHDQPKHTHEHEHQEEREHDHQHAHDHDDECECQPHPTKRPIIIPIPIPVPVPSPVPATNTPLPTQQQPITPEDQTIPKRLRQLKKHHHGEPYEEQQREQNMAMGENEKGTSLQTGAGTVTPTTATGATGGAAGSTAAPTPRDEYGRHGHLPAGTPCRGKHAHTHANVEMAKARDNTLPYNQTWVMAIKVILILAVIVSSIAAFLQLVMAWTVGTHVHKGSWVTSPTTALVATVLIALAGVHGLVALFLFLSKRDQLPHGHFDYGYTLNIVATALALMSPVLFWYTLDTSRAEHLLGEEPVIGRRKYASVE